MTSSPSSGESTLLFPNGTAVTDFALGNGTGTGRLVALANGTKVLEVPGERREYQPSGDIRLGTTRVGLVPGGDLSGL